MNFMATASELSWVARCARSWRSCPPPDFPGARPTEYRRWTIFSVRVWGCEVPHWMTGWWPRRCGSRAARVAAFRRRTAVGVRSVGEGGDSRRRSGSAGERWLAIPRLAANARFLFKASAPATTGLGKLRVHRHVPGKTICFRLFLTDALQASLARKREMRMRQLTGPAEKDFGGVDECQSRIEGELPYRCLAYPGQSRFPLQHGKVPAPATPARRTDAGQAVKRFSAPVLGCPAHSDS